MHRSASKTHHKEVRTVRSTLFVLAGCLAFCSGEPGAASQQARPEPGAVGVNLVLRLAVPLSGNKTTFHFEIENRGDKVEKFDPPFANRSRLRITAPDGRTEEHGAWKEGLEPEELPPGKRKHWRIDLTKYEGFDDKGRYLVVWKHGKLQSNVLTIVKD